MEQNENFAPSEAATDAPASSPNLPAPAPAGDEAYWRGYRAAIAAMPAAGADEGDPDSPRVRRIRCDGFSGAKQAAFLESIAMGFTIVEAAARAGISPTTAYNFRNRRAGRAFNIGWEAASRRARRPLADMLQDRSVAGQTDTVHDKNGAVVGTRHRHDNRLAMAILTRHDRKAETYRDDERLVSVVAEEFEELLDIIEAGGDAEEFIEARRPAEHQYRPRERAPASSPWRLEEHRLRALYENVDPADIDISDLDIHEMTSWTQEQKFRAERADFIARYWRERRAEEEYEEDQDDERELEEDDE